MSPAEAALQVLVHILRRPYSLGVLLSLTIAMHIGLPPQVFLLVLPVDLYLTMAAILLLELTLTLRRPQTHRRFPETPLWVVLASPPILPWLLLLKEWLPTRSRKPLISKIG